MLHTGVDTLTLLSSPEAAYYTLDHVAGPGSSQEHMFKASIDCCGTAASGVLTLRVGGDQMLHVNALKTVLLLQVVGRPIVENALAGFNSTIFAYGQVRHHYCGCGRCVLRKQGGREWPACGNNQGALVYAVPSTPPHLWRLAVQTGSGKTHTMLGDLDDGSAAGPTNPDVLPEGAGLIPRTFAHLFHRICELEGERRQGREVSFSVSVALFEIYKEQVGPRRRIEAAVPRCNGSQQGTTA